MTRMVLLGVIGDTRMRIRRGVGIGGVGVPVDPRTVVQATLLPLSGSARFLLRMLKTNDVDDAGRILEVLRRTIHPITKGAHTATTPPADAGTDPALPKRPLAQRRYRKD